ncbi:hypothetical protein MOQ_009699 [Trypanosoma cruzi marinkellei]|uniref:Pleckstrin homology domain-containing protein n=1 Tax=Trypanosoma cruzi marinkellei TaxID=85056 RepID=K2MHM9_TRYCR|nr:hypothetical protein MOQ_009699 [Trypanosoma cruzi marinkellei]
MDSIHEAHLERILENRRRRGVNANYNNRRGSSTATQTQQWDTTKNVETPILIKYELTPTPRGVPGQSTADEAGPCENVTRATRAEADSELGVLLEKRENKHYKRERLSVNGSGAENDTGSFKYSCSPRFGDRDNGNCERYRCRGNENLQLRWRPLRNFSSFSGENNFDFGRRNGFASARSPSRTVPLLTYGSSDSPNLRWRGVSSRRGRTVSPRALSTWHVGTQNFQRQDGLRAGVLGDDRRSNCRGGNGENQSYGHHDSSPKFYMDSPRGMKQRSNPRRHSTEAAKIPLGPPDERNWQAAGSVIYTGNAAKEEGSPFVSSRQRRQPPGSPLPQGAPISMADRNSMNDPNSDVVGLSSTRTTIDICTSVSILAAGEWFYKWSGNGTSVSPRWVWVDSQSHLLLWAHKETHESTFAGAIKLEKIIQVVFRELQRRNDDGVPQTYYVLLVETSKRILQLATERRMKADTWYEALNNVMSYLRSRKFGASFTPPIS